MSEVHRFLMSGIDDQIRDFHLQVCAALNAIERRGQTMFYTCLSEDREMALETARQTKVTVQEWDGKQWAVIVRPSGMDGAGAGAGEEELP